MIQLTMDLSAVVNALGRGVSYMQKHAQESAARETIGWIKTRTEDGLNMKGAGFPPYTESYKKIRRKLGLSTSPVNLRVTGEMIDKLHYDKGEQSIKTSAEASPRLRGHQFGYTPKGLPARPILGIERSEKPLIENVLRKELKDYIFNK